MESRADVTRRYARAYAKASKKDKGRVLDQVVDVTGWSRDNARRGLASAAALPVERGRRRPHLPVSECRSNCLAIVLPAGRQRVKYVASAFQAF